MRKPPKTRFKAAEGSFAATSAPANESAIAGIIAKTVPPVLTSPFLKWKKRERTDIGKKLMRLIA